MEQAYIRDYHWLEERVVRRYFAAFGSEFTKFCSKGHMGKDFGHGLYEAEIDWLKKEEWAKTVEDVLWRRSKLGLYFNPAQIAHLKKYSGLE